MSELPIPRTTLTEMVGAYQQAETDIRTAYKLLLGATARLESAFQDSARFNIERIGRNGTNPDYDQPDRTMEEVKREAWAILIGKMGLRSVMSIKRAEQLDEQLRTGEDLPEITEANILAMMEGTLSQAKSLVDEAVREVYEWLRPAGWMRSKYVTNQRNEWVLGRKVIISYGVERGWSGGRNFRVSHWKEKNITALDNVFHTLDGKGTVKTYHGPLYDAIHASADGIGETEYFRFKCFKNQNLHIEFKRQDLLDRLNEIAGGNRLPGERGDE